MYPFATFSGIDGVATYSICLKDLRIHIFSERNRKENTTYWISYDKNSIKVSKETYEAVQGLMIECNVKFNRANLPKVPRVQT